MNNTTPNEVLKRLWHDLALPDSALQHVNLTGDDPVLPSSFRVGTASQTTIAAAALAACELGFMRGAPRRDVAVEMLHSALESVGYFSVDGRAPDLFDPLSGLYRCSDGWIRIHAVFEHHRRGALRLLKVDSPTPRRADLELAALQWRALELEQALADAGLVGTALRTFSEWDALPQGMSVASQPLFTIERIGDAPPLPLPALGGDAAKPLEGVRVLDVTRILAGPVAGRTLAAHGAEVMLVNSPDLPNIEAIAETSRGKLSALVNLKTSAGIATFETLLRSAHVVVQSYRPGGIAQLGLGPTTAANLRPGIIYVTLSAYGPSGPWADRRGFDSLVQTAMGFNEAEGKAAGQDQPRALPMQVIDHATGFLIAACVSAALVRQQTEGGSWHLRLSLAQTGHWLRSLGRAEADFSAEKPSANGYLEREASGFGELVSIRHSAQVSGLHTGWQRPSMPPGSHPPAWPE